MDLPPNSYNTWIDVSPSSSISSIVSLDRHDRRDAIISKINRIIADITIALNEKCVLKLSLRNRKTGNETLVHFPSNNPDEANKFACALQVLHLCHQALTGRYIVTKRQIYYGNIDMFRSQAYVDTLVNDIAFTFGVSRGTLNIVAASKGHVAGEIILTLSNGNTVDCSSDDNGTQVPQVEDILNLNIGDAKWILVIEKEATFRSLAASRYFETAVAGPGILVTGKGYPDLATRRFLHIVHSRFRHVPILALVDFDPSGVEIMLTYKYSSQNLRHEPSVKVPGLESLGLDGHDVLGRVQYRPFSTNSSQEDQSSNETPSSSQEAHLASTQPGQMLSTNSFQVISPLTSYDRKKAVNVLTRLHTENDNANGEIGLLNELQRMLMMNFKAEIQAVENDGDITGWLDEKLSGSIH